MAALALVALGLAGFPLPSLLFWSKAGFGLLTLLLLVDVLVLYRLPRGLEGERTLADRLSNGDDNPVQLQFRNRYPFAISLTVIDEVPEQFQARHLQFALQLAAGVQKRHTYFLRPTKRGAYDFGFLNAYVASPLGLASRRYKFALHKEVPVYPSYIQMHKFELLAFSSLPEQGIKRFRRMGQNQEFEQIRDYVQGDDYRTLNWKATARSGQMMVNTYQDERSQQVVSLIDKGRLMHMPFEGLSLLDWSINACLALSNIAIKKGDKAGLITFQEKINLLLPPSRQGGQMNAILEALYKQKTAYKEADFSRLYMGVRRQLPQRSLLLLFTNFESLQGMRRQLPQLRQLARQHLLVVIFFENTELVQLLDAPVKGLEDVYTKTITQKLLHEKKLIVRELQQHGIQSLLTPPQGLTVSVINKYLELKSRGLI
ncbi:hypothetical protein ADICEAN_02368 [Cesiribacter andamanensis AMV16]|uniref:DUF58 domain-containing protein n=2 Tax=Cesiribacter TaxID=1133570 RepID=M7NL25_9BACT|nr:hypothetical protein ADICEAN_02368 [Cesiribacter andamanensis AMV16]